MATIITHPVIALSLSPWLKDVRQSKTLMFVGMLLTILPDIDVIGFHYGVAYGDLWGHRGMTHSLLFALVVGTLMALIVARQRNRLAFKLAVYFSLCIASHGVLDAMTNGGLGVAFFSPFDNQRYFFDFRLIEVSTLDINRFFQGQGVAVLKSELLWVWLPCSVLLVLGYIVRLKPANSRL